MAAFKPAAVLKRDNILETESQNTYVGILSQLSVLVNFAGEIFGGVLKESNATFDRIMNLNQRIDNLSSFIPQLDSYFEQKTLEEVLQNQRAVFSAPAVQQDAIFSGDSMPQALSVTYKTCFSPPALDKMDPFMDNGKKCLELYTNPQFFLLEWVEEQKKLRSAAREQRIKRREERKAQKEKEGSKQIQAPKQIALMDKIMFDPNTGAKIVMKRERTSASSLDVRQSSLNLMKSSSTTSISTTSFVSPETPIQPTFPSAGSLGSSEELMITSEEFQFNALAPPPPPADDFSSSTSFTPGEESTTAPEYMNMNQGPTEEELKQQALLQQQIQLQQQQFYQQQMQQQQYYLQQQELRRQQQEQLQHSTHSLHNSQVAAAPPPPPPQNPNAPPPPPMPNATFTQLSGSTSNLASQMASVQLRKAEIVAKKPVDARSGLLDGIRGGIALRAVTKTDQPKKEDEGLKSVAAILARRIAIAPEDSDDDDDDDDESNWD